MTLNWRLISRPKEAIREVLKLKDNEKVAKTEYYLYWKMCISNFGAHFNFLESLILRLGAGAAFLKILFGAVNYTFVAGVGIGWLIIQSLGGHLINLKGISQRENDLNNRLNPQMMEIIRKLDENGQK